MYIASLGDFSYWKLLASSTMVTVRLSPPRCLSDWSAFQGETEVTLNTTVLDPLTDSNLTLVIGITQMTNKQGNIKIAACRQVI